MKIVQTAGRAALGEFAPEFAHFNDDVLFGENWNNQDKTGNPDHMKSNAEVDFEINAEDMEILKNFKKIESYGESGIFPVYGGKM